MMPNTLTPLMLDTRRVLVDSDGICDFWWPVPMESYKAMIAPLAGAVVESIRNASAKGWAIADPVRIVCHHLLSDSLALYQAQLVTNALPRSRPVIWPGSARLAPALAEGAVPGTPNIIKILRNRMPQWRRRRALARFARDAFIDFCGAESIRRLRYKIDYERHVISTTIDPLSQRHARQERSQVQFIAPEFWFDAVRARERAIAQREIDSIIAAFADGFAAGGGTVTDVITEYFRMSYAEAIRLSAGYLAQLSAKHPRMPQELWTGSGGNIYVRMLRRLARRAGGRVVGHDHGTTHGHLVGELNKTLVEFDDCDVFVTFTAHQAQGIAEAARPELLVEQMAPDIRAVPQLSLREMGFRRDGRSHKVMYVGTVYNGEFVTYQTTMSDMTLVDWHARVLGQLKRAGFDVIWKPHPGGTNRAPELMAASMGAQTLDGKFEDLIDNADVFVFDDPYSSAFASALTSDAGVVLVDIGLAAFRTDAFDLLRRRCGIVRGWFAKDGRVQVDWPHLFDTIKSAVFLRNPQFARQYITN